MSDIISKEALNQIVRRHKKTARRKKRLDPARQKSQASGGVGVADASTPQAAT